MSLHTEPPQASTARWAHARLFAAGIAFVALITVMNVALNRVIALSQPLMPAAFRYEYVVSLPLSPLAAVGLLVSTLLCAATSLLLFVTSLAAASEQAAGSSAHTTVGRLVRGTAVLAFGLALAVVGAGFLLVPGFLILLYVSLVAIAIVTEGDTVRGAIKASHTRLTSRPLPYVGITCAVLGLTITIGVAGMVTSVLSPTAEFIAGGLGTGGVVLLGMRSLTRLYHANRSTTATTATQDERL